MEKLNVAIADDNERVVELLDRIVSSDEELNVVEKPETEKNFTISSRQKSRMWSFWILSCRRWMD